MLNAARVVQVVGSVTTATGNEYRRAATPVEIYRIQNTIRLSNGKTLSSASRRTSPIVLSIELEEIVVTPDAPIDIIVKVDRQNGNRQNLNLTAVGLPFGVRLQRQNTLLRSNQTEATLTLVPNIIRAGNNELRRNPFIGTPAERVRTPLSSTHRSAADRSEQSCHKTLAR